MLISKGLCEGDIFLLRTANGDELLARITSLTDAEIVLEKPLQVLVLNQNVGMIDYSVVSDSSKGYHIFRSHIAGYGYPSSAAEKHYLQHISGIQIATA